MKDGPCQVVALIDGHGKYGDLVAKTAVCAMFANVKTIMRLQTASDEQVQTIVRGCFKAVQRQLKSNYRKWLDSAYPIKQQKKIDQEIYGRKPEVSAAEKEQLCESSDWSDGDLSEGTQKSDDFEEIEVKEYEDFKRQTAANAEAEGIQLVEYEMQPEQKKTKSPFDLSMSGASCTLVFRLPDKLIIGWIGATRVALHRDNGSEWLTHDHRPSDLAEQLRIYQHNGEVRQGLRCGRPLVYLRGRTYPATPLSRSLGDVLAHQIGVTSEPSVLQVSIEAEDKFSVASEQVWRSLTPNEIGKMIKTKPKDIKKEILEAIHAANKSAHDLAFVVSL